MTQPHCHLHAGFLRSSTRSLLLLLFACIASSHFCAAALSQTVEVAAPPSSESISLADYKSRLDSLDRHVVSCQQAVTAANCQSSQVGSDLTVTLPSGPRHVSFGWLRDLFDRIAKPKPPATATKEPADFVSPSLALQLEDARLRLAADRDLVSENQSAPDYKPQREALDRILADKQYHAAVARPTLLQRFLEKLGNWIDTAIGRLQRAGFQSRWIGLTAEIIFGLLVTGAVVWFAIRLERQGRLGPGMLGPGSFNGAVSARDWQLWLEDARNAAAQGAWRDAIHFLYWASISRLESSGLWPADRARTPREYLALLPQTSAQRPSLAILTRSFERTWYAGRPAQESDFREAEQLAAQLGIHSVSGTSNPLGAL